MLVHVQCKPTMRRSRVVADSFANGLKVNGDEIVRTNTHIVSDADGIMAYSSRHNAMFDQYRRKGKFTIFADLGYWGRKKADSYDLGCHRVIVNGLHPNKYFRQNYSSDRFDELDIKIQDWKINKDGPIILTGVSTKACEFYKYELMEWETKTLEEIKKHSSREVVFLAKPQPGLSLKGTTNGRNMSYKELIRKSWMVVNHHSHSGLDALIEGIPIYNYMGISKEMGISDLKYIEYPKYPEDRKAFFADVAYTQWSMMELYNGSCWNHIKNEVLPRCA